MCHQLNDLVTTQFQGAKEDFSAFGERMTSKLDDAALTTRFRPQLFSC
jgi:hypothetical protein